MRVDALTLEGWRNYQRQQLTFDDGCNVIYGENAQGKTNLLEAIVYLSCGKSPRAHGDRELIGFDRQDALLVGQIFSRQREFVTDIRLSRSKRRSMTVNGVKAKNGAALSDVLHTVFFAPEDAVQTGVLSFRVDGRDCEELGESLAERGVAVRAGLHCAPLAHRTAGTVDTGTMRCSFSAFNTEAQVDEFVRIMRQILR